jgi:uncharacterized membrane protein HdeD (DUF308 family)
MATLRGGLLLAAGGVVLTLLTRSKIGLLVVFAGFALMLYGAARACLPGSSEREERPIF